MDCFAQDGFAQRDFIQGCSVDTTGTLANSVLDFRIPRWLLKFDRLGQLTFLSDVGGEVEGIFYIPAVIDVQHSPLELDLERMSIPRPSATVHISPSALKEHFIDINELGQAKVTIYSWDGYKARAIIKADMQQPEWGYDGEPTSFRLVEDFKHNPHYPPVQVDLDGFDKATLIPGARFHAYTQVWGSPEKESAFQLMTVDGGILYMSAGHDSPTLPEGNNRYKDKQNRTYIGFVSTDPIPGDVGVTWSNAQGITNAGDLLRVLIDKYSEYPVDEQDVGRLSELYDYLRQFSASGWTNDQGELFNFIAGRFQTEYLFVVWEEAGLLTGTAINPTGTPVRTLVFRVHLLQLQDTVKEDPRYTRFKVRFHYRPDDGWFKLTLDDRNSPYLKEAHRRWGGTTFGNPVDIPIHNNSVDLPDVFNDGTAKNIMMRLAQLFHRGQRAPYMQFAEFSEIGLGRILLLVDPERNYNLKPAILIGRQWLTPELIVNTFRTIEPFEIPEPISAGGPPVPEGGGGGGGPGGDCPDIFPAAAGFNDSSWTKTNGVSFSSLSQSANDVTITRNPVGAGLDTYDLVKHLDSNTWGSCTHLRITFSYVLEIDEAFGVPQIALTHGLPVPFQNGEVDATGVGTKSGTVTYDYFPTSVDGVAPFQYDFFIHLQLNGTFRGHAEITMLEFDFVP
jgi:hypothetical protein